MRRVAILKQLEMRACQSFGVKMINFALYSLLAELLDYD
jgi:hypothetical protein